MSKIFYDDLVVFESLEVHVKNIAQTPEEREELWKIIDETLHHRMMGCILDYLPEELHEEFLEKFHHAPHDEGLFDYLDEKTQKDIRAIVKEEIIKLEQELLKELRKGDSTHETLKGK
jgi:hypothetical protein